MANRQRRRKGSQGYLPMQNDAKISLDFEVARQAELQAEASHQMATSAHRLNVLAAFFFPLATLSAVLGANLQNVFTGISPKSALGVMLIVGLILGHVDASVA